MNHVQEVIATLGLIVVACLIAACGDVASGGNRIEGFGE